MRSIAYGFRLHSGIRTYAICPGAFKTNLMTAEEKAPFPESMWTPIEKVVAVIAMLIAGGAVEDSKGRRVPAEDNYGLVVEINDDKHYFRDRPEYCDDLMAQNMYNTSLEFVTKNSS